MKKLTAIILSVLMLLAAMTGCAKPAPEEAPTDTPAAETPAPAAETPPPSEETPDTAEAGDEVNSFYTITDDSEDDLCALFFLGSTEEDAVAKLSEVLGEYSIPLKADDSAIVKAGEGGTEWYLLLPKYADSTVTVSPVEFKDDGTLAVSGEAAASSEGPMLLQCNISDIIPQYEVKVTHGSQSVSFSPQLSLEDGEPMEFDMVYTR